MPSKLWNEVTRRLEQNDQAHRTEKSQSTASPLTGKLFDSNGVRFTPTHAVKNGNRYRYYTSQAVIQRAGRKPDVTRFPADRLEQLVKSQVQSLLESGSKCTAGMKNTSNRNEIENRAKDLAKQWPALDTLRKDQIVREIVKRVTVSKNTVWIEIDRVKLFNALLDKSSNRQKIDYVTRLNPLKLTCDFTVMRCKGQVRMVVPNDPASPYLRQEPSLVKAIARGREWADRLINGEIHTVREIAQKVGVTERYISRILQCANLSPRIIESILKGEQTAKLTTDQFLSRIPLCWREQERRFVY